MNKRTVLLVDDDLNNIKLLKQILQTEYVVRVTLKSDEALAMASSSPQPDLILLDIMMPSMDGYETCRTLKSNPVTAHIPVIFVTAMNRAQDVVKGFAAGAVDYIQKPISVPIVLARVKMQDFLNLQLLCTIWGKMEKHTTIGFQILQLKNHWDKRKSTYEMDFTSEAG